ncbi:MAG: AraC family transcriptional regulator [Pseudomonadales bacterium]|nr:AraC family transcriptional regulator [Pseudomonadales bacterium]
MYQSPEPLNSVPVKRAIQLLEGAKRSGVKVEELLEEVGIDPASAYDPDARVDKNKFIHLMLTIMRRTEDEFMGFGFGRKSKPGTFSMMAHAVINCSTLEKAIRRSLKFYELFDHRGRAELELTDTDAIFSVPFTEDSEIGPYLVEAIIFLSIRFMSWLVGQQIVPRQITVEFPEQDDDEEYKELFSCPVLFNQSANQIVFDRKYFEMPLVQNPLSLSRFLKSSLAELMEGNIQNASLNAQIRNIISKEFGNNFPDFSIICGKLNMTPQTLRRRLKEESTSYQTIKDSIRKDASIFYLSKHELSIDEIALLMGFSEASSFHRAFKKWTGKTPSVYRAELLYRKEI